MECSLEPVSSYTTEKIVSSCDESLPEVASHLHGEVAGSSKLEYQSKLHKDFPGLIRCHTVEEALVVRETEDPIAITPRANSTSEFADESCFTAWEATSTTSTRITMPAGKFIQASFSASGLTLMLLSDREIIIYSMENSDAIIPGFLRARQSLVRNYKDLNRLDSLGKVRSVSVNDSYILLREDGKVGHFYDTLQSIVLIRFFEVTLYQMHFDGSRTTQICSDWERLDTSDCPADSKLCNALVSRDGNFVLQYHDYLLFWRRLGSVHPIQQRRDPSNIHQTNEPPYPKT
ncbi:MAG: hypothetical protein Q9213_001827 [Squamulea squamosa]